MSLVKVKSAELSKETRQLISKARRGPVLITAPGKRTVVIQEMAEEDLIDELLLQHPQIKASIRKANREIAAGKGTSISEVRKQALARSTRHR